VLLLLPLKIKVFSAAIRVFIVALLALPMANNPANPLGYPA